MAELAAITPERHAKKVWKHVTDYAFVAEDAGIPLVGAELGKAALAMPIGLIKIDAGYQLVAITSLQPGTNLYVAPDGKWLGGYIPAALRGYPFQLAQQEGAGEFILCINEGSGLVVENTEDGNPFFDDQDQPTQGIKDILNFLTQIKASRDVTEGAVNALADAGLIMPWKINLKQGEKVVPVKGLFSIDEAALNKLDDEDFLAVRKAGGLALAYAQLLSMNQLTVLERLGKLQGQILEQQAAAAEVSNLTGFSLSEDEGSLMFD
ncbi:MAG: SapC family protein [Proteobacteria bacterium]|nr:SapC family protein [Pseudomonadota bacterium]